MQRGNDLKFHYRIKVEMIQKIERKTFLHHYEYKNFCNRFLTLILEFAFLEYEEHEPGKVNYYHTEVPTSHKGKGLGNILAKAAFDWAVQNNKKVIPSCWFIRDVFLPKNSEYQKIVINQNPPGSKM
jgi:predicted GNAT family acetyltransferase